MTIHVEAAPHLRGSLSRIRELGCTASRTEPRDPLTTVRRGASRSRPSLVMTVNPALRQEFIPSSPDKSRALAPPQRRSKPRSARGRWRNRGATRLPPSGARGCTFVGGNSIFSADDPRAEIGRLATSAPKLYEQRGVVLLFCSHGWTDRRRTRRRQALPRQRLAPLVGSQSTELRAATLIASPREKSLSDYKGNVIMINIWATWCKRVCRDAEHRAAASGYAPRGLKIIAVSVDDPGMTTRSESS